MENEPSSIKIVKSHMKQLGSIICEHMSKKESLPGKILVHQGLFVGSWGEMHGSKFLSEARMKELSDTFLEATKGSCPIAVRKPVQLRQLSCQKTASNINFTLFNDAIFGSETDLAHTAQYAKVHCLKTAKEKRHLGHVKTSFHGSKALCSKAFVEERCLAG